MAVKLGVLKQSIIQRPSVFERKIKIIRKICGPTKEANGICRIEIECPKLSQ